MKHNSKVVIFSGYNMRAVIAFIRTLESNNVDYSIVAISEKDYIFKTIYKDKVAFVRRNSDLILSEVSEILCKLNSDGAMLFIAPITEYLNRFLLDNREFFIRHNCIIPLVEKSLYEQISDKDSFAKLCLSNNIRVPLTYNEYDVSKLPLVAKPKQYVSSDGEIYIPIFLNSHEDYVNFFGSHPTSDFCFQEMLGIGESIYLLFYFDKDGNEYVTSQRNLLQQGGGKSIVAAISADYHTDNSLVGPYVSLFKNCNFSGPVMIEIRRVNGVDYMIEANPRFWGPSQLFCDAGYNLFELLLYDYNLIDKRPVLQCNKHTTYYWSGGITDISDTYSHEGRHELFDSQKASFISNDIYKRGDTMELFQAEKLKNLYMNSSKHSNYQILASSVNKLIDTDSIQTKSRWEQERFNYIISKINIKNQFMLDIGGNTGFFTFESIDAGASHVDYYEGNTAHAEFVDLAAQMLSLESKISVFPEYFLFDSKRTKYNIIYNLNVVHHFGDDFGGKVDIEAAKNEMIKCINNMADITEYMVFQIGFNWKGNRNLCLFENGTKQEMIDFIKENCTKWDIVNIGIASKDSCGDVQYSDLDDNNIKRDDSLGEFLNRPIFIMKAK